MYRFMLPIQYIRTALAPISVLVRSYCAFNQDNNMIIQYADDTTILGLIKGKDKSSHRDLVHKITVYGEDIDLVLNLDKTQELILYSCILSLSSGQWLRGQRASGI